jgi:hypothetical protein
MGRMIRKLNRLFRFHPDVEMQEAMLRAKERKNNKQSIHMKVESLEIDRSKWRSGGNGKEGEQLKTQTGRGKTQLLNHEGYMCCLGFLGAQLGITDTRLLGATVPADISYPPNCNIFDEEIKKLPNPFETIDIAEKFATTTNFFNEAMWANDHKTDQNELREREVKIAFKKYLDCEVTFVGEYELREQD